MAWLIRSSIFALFLGIVVDDGGDWEVVGQKIDVLSFEILAGFMIVV